MSSMLFILVPPEYIVARKGDCRKILLLWQEMVDQPDGNLTRATFPTENINLHQALGYKLPLPRLP